MTCTIAWKLFKVDKNDKFFKRNLHNASISRGGKGAKISTTKNMINHLKKCHNEDFLKEPGYMKRETADAGCSSVTANSSTQRQATITQLMEKKKCKI